MASLIELAEIILCIYEYVKMNPTLMYKYNINRIFLILRARKKYVKLRYFVQLRPDVVKSPVSNKPNGKYCRIIEMMFT